MGTVGRVSFWAFPIPNLHPLGIEIDIWDSATMDNTRRVSRFAGRAGNSSSSSSIFFLHLSLPLGLLGVGTGRAGWFLGVFCTRSMPIRYWNWYPRPDYKGQYPPGLRICGMGRIIRVLSGCPGRAGNSSSSIFLSAPPLLSLFFSFIFFHSLSLMCFFLSCVSLSCIFET